MTLLRALTRRLRAFSPLALSVLGALFIPPASAQMYGPRQFWPAPVGTNVFTLNSIYTSSNTVVDTSIVYPNLNVDTFVVAPSYSHFFGVGSQLIQATVALPYAWADLAVAESRTGINRNPRRKGLADAYGHLTFGLLNAPALPPKEFASFMGTENPEVVIFAMAGMFAPTGAYDTDPPLDHL
jgi:hypothetical protein